MFLTIIYQDKSSLPDGRHCQVAVKIINDSKEEGEDFINEADRISRIHVQIKGSLDKFIFKTRLPEGICSFNWNAVYQTAISIAWD